MHLLRMVTIGILTITSLIPTSAQQITKPTEVKGLKKIPPIFHGRCSPKLRIDRIKKAGGDINTEAAVLHALEYLKSTQNPDGSWCRNRSVSMTAFSILCFVGHGEGITSPAFGENIKKGLEYLIKVARKNKGKLTNDPRDDHWPYEHAIATYALAEAYTLCVRGYEEDVPMLKKVVQVCGQLLINSQHKSGGWDYSYSQDSGRGGDVSITGWQMQALHACKSTGIDFRNVNKAYKRGLEYIESKQMASGAIGYSSPSLHGSQDGTTLAAVGAHCFQTWKSSSNKVARKACKFIDQKMKFDWDTPDSDLYGHYHAGMAMYQHGGEKWEKYRDMVEPQLLENQKEDGSFFDISDKRRVKAVASLYKGESRFATHYRTCLATLMLQVYYRYPEPTTSEK